jgi:transposase-like protein
MRKTNVR